MKIESTVNLTRYKTLDKLGTYERVGKIIGSEAEGITVVLERGFVFPSGSRCLREYTVREILKQMRTFRGVK